MSTRAEAASIQNCAAAHRVGVRAVRGWRARRDPRWLAWQAQEAKNATQTELRIGAVETSPAAEEAAAAARFHALQRLVDGALAGQNHTGLPLLLKSAQEAQKLLQGCRAATVEHEKAVGDLVPKADLVALLTGWMGPITALLKMLPAEVAGLVPSDIQQDTRAKVQTLIDDRMRAVHREAGQRVRELVGEVAK